MRTKSVPLRNPAPVTPAGSDETRMSPALGAVCPIPELVELLIPVGMKS